MAKSLWAAVRGMPKTPNAARQPAPATSAPARPFLQWVGGKREMISRFPGLVPSFKGKYYEPFLGGGAMLFHLRPARAVLADNNAELITAYEAVRDEPDAVIHRLKQLKARHSSDLYYLVRSLDRDSDFARWSAADVAARLIYLNQTGFNGLYRVNRKGQFNVPLGSSLDRVICDPATIRAASRLLKGHRLSSCDFAEAVRTAGPGDFVFLDPPYVPAGGYADFTRYTKEQFSEDDQRRLADCYRAAADRGALVLLTNSDTPLVRELYADWHLHEISSSRNLNARAERRRDIGELAITNYPVSNLA